MDTTASGIVAVGEIEYGSHFCQFYRNREDLIDCLVPYFDAGLKATDLCLWVTSDPLGRDEARSRLSEVAGVSDAERRGQLRILDSAEAYGVSDGGSLADAGVRRWLELEGWALKHGYRGVRVTGNASWLETADWESFANYEANVNELLRGHRIIALCSYPLGRCHPEDVLDVVRSHQFALARRAGAWDLLESSSLKAAKAELAELARTLEQKVLERTAELELALRSRDEFLSVASHELRTPLAAMQLYLDGLARGVERGAASVEQMQARLAKALRQCERLGELVSELLRFSRDTQGRSSLELERVDLAQVAREAANRMSQLLAHAGCVLEVTAAHPVCGKWDRQRLERIVTNLLSNAARHAPGARVSLTVERSGDSGLLSVVDDGPGIAVGDQDQLFERFGQVPNRPAVGGFGLGLWIVKQSARAMGGSVRLKSDLKQGAAFHVELPLAGPALHNAE